MKYSYIVIYTINHSEMGVMFTNLANHGAVDKPEGIGCQTSKASV